MVAKLCTVALFSYFFRLAASIPFLISSSRDSPVSFEAFWISAFSSVVTLI